MRPFRRAGLASVEHLLVMAVLGTLLVLGVGGCGSQGYKAASVSGTVTLDGKPLPGIGVTFQPIAGDTGQAPGPGSVGQTDANGRYDLQLVVMGQKKKGAVVGNHRVTFATMQPERDPADDRSLPPAKELLPPQYRGKSMNFTVPAGGTDKADFPLTSK